MNPSNTDDTDSMALDGRNRLNLPIDQYHIRRIPGHIPHMLVTVSLAICPPKPEKPEKQQLEIHLALNVLQARLAIGAAKVSLPMKKKYLRTEIS
jgi:hypothetical protein